MSTRKVKKLNIDIPLHIRLLSGSTYYDSKTGAHIHVNNLEEYITGKKPEAPKAKKEVAKEVTELHALDVMSRRWDLHTKDYED